MTTPLRQRQYAIRCVVADIGWITDEERRDVADIIGADGIVQFIAATKELHLYWPLPADTLDGALNDARATLRRATEATGVACPRTRKLDVCEIGQ